MKHDETVALYYLFYICLWLDDCRLFVALLGKAAKVKSAHAERTQRGTCTKCGSWMIWMYVLGSLVFLHVFFPMSFPRLLWWLIAGCSISTAEAYTSLGFQSEAKSPGESILGLLDVGDDPIRRAVLRGRLMRFFACLPKVSAEHAALLLQAVEAFFGARLYCAHLSGQDKEAKEASKSFAVGAVRLVCHYLGKAKESLASYGCDAAELQLNVVKQTAAAYLSAPCAEAKGLAHALGTAILASADGGPCFDWAGKNTEKLRDAARSLLRDWSPATSAKTTTLLLQEIHYAGQVPPETGREFAQEALDSAADFRHDLAVLGLTPIANPGVRGSTKTLYVPNPRVGYWRKPEPVTQNPRQLPDQMEEEEEWEELAEMC